MNVHRPAGQRGRTTHGTRTRLCSFSSGDYVDTDWMGFGALRQLNEEHLPAGATVASQRVANMELLALVLDGVLMRGDVTLAAGALAWTGAGHASDTPVETAGADGARVLRIAIQPGRVNLPPAAAIRRADTAADTWTLLAGPDARPDVLPLRQQTWLRQVRLSPAGRVDLTLDPSQRHWLQVLRGAVTIDGWAMTSGDGAGWSDEALAADLVAGADGATALLLTLPR